MSILHNKFLPVVAIKIISVAIVICVGLGATYFYRTVIVGEYSFKTTYTEKDINSDLLENDFFTTSTGSGSIYGPLGSAQQSGNPDRLDQVLTFSVLDTNEESLANVVIIPQSIPKDVDQNIYRKDSVKNLIKSAESGGSLQNVKVDTVAKVKKGSVKAIVLGSHGEVKGVKFNFLQYMTVKNDNLYVVTAAAPSDTWDELEASILSSLLTFEVKGH